METIFGMVSDHNSWMDRAEILKAFKDNNKLVSKIWADGESIPLNETCVRESLLKLSGTIEFVQCEKRLKIVFKRIAGNEYEWALLPA